MPGAGCHGDLAVMGLPGDTLNVTVIVVGLDHWEDYTKPCVESILYTNPGFKVVCVDNGSIKPYDIIPGVTLIRSDERRSYAGGINLGLRHAPVSDWYLVINNDVLFEKYFEDRIPELDKRALYGFKLWPMGTAGMPTKYMCGWALFVSQYMYRMIGDFDENCKPMFFEDADYSIRVLKAGYELIELDRQEYGMRHLEDERMGERVDYYRRNQQARQNVRNYIKRKHGY